MHTMKSQLSQNLEEIKNSDKMFYTVWTHFENEVF